MFEIKATNLHWLDTLDESLDLCLHGAAWARIGDECFEFKNATVSATAFYLLRSLTKDHVMYQMPTQLLPCCGHDMRIWKEELIICGCPNGIDWSVIHENGQVKLIPKAKKKSYCLWMITVRPCLLLLTRLRPSIRTARRRSLNVRKIRKPTRSSGKNGAKEDIHNKKSQRSFPLGFSCFR